MVLESKVRGSSPGWRDQFIVSPAELRTDGIPVRVCVGQPELAGRQVGGNMCVCGLAIQRAVPPLSGSTTQWRRPNRGHCGRGGHIGAEARDLPEMTRNAKARDVYASGPPAATPHTKLIRRCRKRKAAGRHRPFCSVIGIG